MRCRPIVLVGHSGGGLLLPVIADAVAPPVSGLIFVDSGVPASTGETPLVPESFLAHLRTLDVDGMLPPWSSWFGEDAMRTLVPDEALRTALVREMPSLPLADFEERLPSPAGWERRPCAYLLLSDAYREAAAEARERGWPVEEITERSTSTSRWPPKRSPTR
jgi:pimeloyl-ACP methyl ester carboxylesterase